MRPLPVAIAAFGSTGFVAAVSHGPVESAAEAAAMVALAVCAGSAEPAAPRPLRRTLVGFCLLLGVSAAVEAAAARVHIPPLTMAANGCPVATGAPATYWHGQLRYAQAADIVRFVALACAVRAVRLLPRPIRPVSRRRRLVLGLLLVPPVVVGVLAPGYDSPSQLAGVAPAWPALLTAAALTALAAARTSGRPEQNAALILGAALSLLTAMPAAEGLATIVRQFPEPASATSATLNMCLYAVDTGTAAAGGPPDLLDVVGTALVIVAPVLVVWSALQRRPARI